MKRYYVLDIDGRELASFKWSRSGAILLDEPEDKYRIWTGTEWVFDLVNYKYLSIHKLGEGINSKGVFVIMEERDITYDIVFLQWKEAKTNIMVQANRTEVDNLMDTYYSVLGL